MKTETKITNANGKFKIEVINTLESKRRLKARQLRVLHGLLKHPQLSEQTRKSFVSSYLSSINGEKENGVINSGSVHDYVIMEKHKNRSTKLDLLIQRGPNFFLQQLLNKFDPTISKKPTKGRYLGQYIGVEIECFIPLKSMNLEGIHDVECESCGGSGNNTDDDGNEYECDECDGSGLISSNHDESSVGSASRAYLKREIIKRRIANVQFKSDGSIDCDHDEYFPIEFTALFLQDDKSSLKKLCEMLSDLGAKVNKSCGLHVHLDQRDQYDETTRSYNKTIVTQRAMRLYNALPLFMSMVPKYRRSNSYCKPDISAYDGDRYCAINRTALSKYGTIEIRMHSASTNFTKISNWVDLLFLISRTKPQGEVLDVDDLVDLGASDALLEYVAMRVNTFSNDAKVKERGDAEDVSVAS